MQLTTSGFGSLLPQSAVLLYRDDDSNRLAVLLDDHMLGAMRDATYGVLHL